MVRIFKILKVFNFKDSLFKLGITTVSGRLYKIYILAIVFVHLMSCFWFAVANFGVNQYDNWVGGRGIMTSSPFEQYMNSIYWAL